MNSTIANIKLHPFADRRFRSNPTLDVVPVSALRSRERRFLVGTGRAATSLWLVRTRRGTGLTHRIIGADTASVLRRLQRPGKLPADLTRDRASSVSSAVARLILDHFLEIESENGFVGGPAAHAFVVRGSAPLLARGRIHHLTIEALHYARALDLVAPRILGHRLYAFNTIPDSAALARLLPDNAAIRAFLQIDDRGETARLLRRDWRRVPARARAAPWIVWIPRHIGEPSPGPIRYKIYVSPALAATRDAFAAVVGVLPDLGAARFKVGRDRAGLLRPDKFVLYFRSSSEVKRALRSLRTILDGARAQGVPFTAADDDSGVLSWGIDPARTALGVEWSHVGSWRAWVALRLASYLLAARGAGEVGVSPVTFAVDRVALDGVDTRRWAAREDSN